MAKMQCTQLASQFVSSMDGNVNMFTRLTGTRFTNPNGESKVAEKNKVVVQFEGSPNKDSGWFAAEFDLTPEGLDAARAEFSRRIAL